jgi:molybdopterin converting factor small subunit
MAVTIQIPLIHRHLTGDVATLAVEGKTVGECLHELVKAFPKMEAALFDDKGQIQKLVEIFLNAENAFPDELAQKTKDGDEIFIATILSGG